jgi:hypothetical protein
MKRQRRHQKQKYEHDGQLDEKKQDESAKTLFRRS